MPEKEIALAGTHKESLSVYLTAVEPAISDPVIEFLARKPSDRLLQLREQFVLFIGIILFDALQPIEFKLQLLLFNGRQRPIFPSLVKCRRRFLELPLQLELICL